MLEQICVLRHYPPEVSLGLSVWQRSLLERDSMDVWKKWFRGLLTIKYGNVYMFGHVFGNKYGVKGSFCSLSLKLCRPIRHVFVIEHSVLQCQRDTFTIHLHVWVNCNDLASMLGILVPASSSEGTGDMSTVILGPPCCLRLHDSPLHHDKFDHAVKSHVAY